jgi:hypothetical protein
MEIIEAGHAYNVANVQEGTQTISFIQKDVQEGSNELTVVKDGTTNEEVLAVMIDRMEYLQGRVPSDINAQVITSLQTALTLLDQRTAERIERGVEGTNQA